MDARLDLLTAPGADKVLKQLMSAGRSMKETSPLPPALQELVALRISQINGCATCVDIHTKEATAAGETPLRLHLVATWREATVFTEPERAALELAEQGTRIADAPVGVSDPIWSRAAEHFDEAELTSLVLTIAFMNAANRMNVITRRPAGDYVAGQLG
ncbi:carboxymuconolactone decarboxylase family protein [Streptomyces sp. NPDC048057]|uniref:carboxymuconolactone decarboxylase family protein n=1 Tax=Streptomyces sp. NPDC048057 TaxID=3155628 RepID=UPI0033FBEC84